MVDTYPAAPAATRWNLVARMVVFEGVALIPVLLRAPNEGLLGIGAVAEHDGEKVVVGPTDDVGAHGGIPSPSPHFLAAGAGLRPRRELAARWEVIPAGTNPDYPGRPTWRFFLRPGVKFHSGADFTAADVKWSLDRARAQNLDTSLTMSASGASSSFSSPSGSAA